MDRKLMFLVVRYSDSDLVVQALIENHIRVTRIASTGGFLRHGNVTLMTGVEEDQVDQIIALLRQVCCPAEESQHRVTFFVVDMPFFEQI